MTLSNNEGKAMHPFIVVGDRTSHGGVVISGSETTEVEGKRVARIGDQVTCPRKGHGSVTTIVTGDLTAIIDGRPLARHGDKTACGATLISGQVLAYVDKSGGDGEAAASALGHVAASQAGNSPLTSGYDQHFSLIDETTGKPLANRAYRIKWTGGIIEGRTNEAGLTSKVKADLPEEVTIEVFAEGA